MSPILKPAERFQKKPRVMVLDKKERSFLDENLKINSWEDIKSYYGLLLNRDIDSLEALKKWLEDRSELEAVLEEDLAWRYIRMNIDTTDEALVKSFQLFVQEIEPKIAPISNQLDEKLTASKFFEELNKPPYWVFFRSLKNRIELFRGKNVPLFADLQTKSQEYGARVGKLSVEINGQEKTLQQAALELKNTDRSVREVVFNKMASTKNSIAPELNALFDVLLEKRHQVAINAGQKNFRDYMFLDLGRFDYGVKDCTQFHDSVKEAIVPIVTEFQENRKKNLKLEVLKPWDLEVDSLGRKALKPFLDSDELLEKTIACFNRLDPFFGECLSIMNAMGHLDLDSKKGKAPGGFNYPLYETGVPFIYMNSVGSFRDMITMVHEGGHAVHSFLTHQYNINEFKSCPSEVAELASMGMELLSMDHWEVFFSDKNDLRRAKQEHLEKILGILPWIAIVDKYQHWLYLNPKHSHKERGDKWLEILQEFGTGMVDWEGHQDYKVNTWQSQLHIFEVPFYYIEYGLAQLGAISLWRNYKQNPGLAIENYKKALSLGYTQSIPDVYSAAGISFDFSREYITELADFVKGELNGL